MTIDAEQRALLPQPGFSPQSEAYWLAAGKGELVVQRCSSCGSDRWPISAACFNCQSTESTWAALPGTGKVFTFTWADFPILPNGEERNITVIELDGTQGDHPVRMISWVADIARDELVCDLPVEVTFLPVDDEVSVPAWRPRR
jgi:uncharacterized OB-fold protein